MSRNKLMLNMVVEEDYALIAIYSSLEPYRMAFLLNKYLGIKLSREKLDIDFKHKELVAFYPLYHFYDRNNCLGYYLVSNKYKGSIEQKRFSEELFAEGSAVTTYLMQEHKNVDYFLKIEEVEAEDLKKILSKIQEIEQIITASSIEVDTLKSKDNLIFN